MLVAEGKMLRPDDRLAGVEMHIDRRGRDFPKQHPGGDEGSQDEGDDRGLAAIGKEAHAAAARGGQRGRLALEHAAVCIAPC